MEISVVIFISYICGSIPFGLVLTKLVINSDLDGFFKIIKLKNTYEKPSEKKKRILQENIKRVKKLNKLKNRI